MYILTYYFAQSWYTIQHRTVLIMFIYIFQIVTDVQMNPKPKMLPLSPHQHHHVHAPIWNLAVSMVKPIWILLMKQEMMGWQWHQLDHMQIIGISFQTDKHDRTSSLNFLQARCSSWCPTNSVKALKATNTRQRTGEIIINKYLPTTYNASMVGRATECNSQHGRTLFAVVRHCTIFTNSTNCYCIHRVGITIVVAVVTDDAAVSAGNNVNGSVSTATKLDTMPHTFDCDVLRSINYFTIVLRAPATTSANNTSVATLNNNHYVP